MRDLLMILFVTCSTLGSQVLIKGVVVAIAERDPDAAGVSWLLAVLHSPRIWLAVAMQGLGFLVWIVVVSRVKLGPAFAMSGASFYILLAAVSWLLYGERLTLSQWAGVVLISAGVLMMTMLGQEV